MAYDLLIKNGHIVGARRLKQVARGISHTVVNGELLIEGGGHTGAYPGRVVRNEYARNHRRAQG